MSTFRVLRQRRWLALGFVVLLVIPSFLLLSRWQLNRLEERRTTNDLIARHSAAQPVPVDEVMTPGAPGGTVTDEQRWLPVTATGRYDVAGEVLVRKRPLEGRNGFWVVTPFVTSGGAVLVVNRGWVEAAGGADAVQAVPAPPSGEVSLIGRVQPSQDAPVPQPTDLPDGQITDLSVPLVADGAQAYPGYVTLVESRPSQGDVPVPIPLPEQSDGPHLSYAVQWVFFAVVAVVGFVVLVRREQEYGEAELAAREAADAAQESAGPTA